MIKKPGVHAQGREYFGRCGQGDLGPRGEMSSWTKLRLSYRDQRRRDVAKEIELEDKFENMGAQMVREVASKTRMWRATAPPRPPFWRRPFIGRVEAGCGRAQSHGTEERD